MLKTKPGSFTRRMRRTRNKPLPRRDYHYDLEMLEPRLLLSVALNDNSGIQVQNQIQTQVANLFDYAQQMGQAINQNTLLNETALPLFNITVNDLAQTPAGTGKRLGDIFSEQFKTYSNNYFNANKTGKGTATSDGLAAALNQALTAAGISGTVTDSSERRNNNDIKLKLDFDLSMASTNQTRAIEVGDAAQELRLDFGSDAQVNLGVSRTVRFSILADISSMTVQGLNDTKFGLDFSTDAFSLSGAASTLNSGFGVQVGMLGMRPSAGATGAYADGGSIDFKLNVDLDFIGAGADNYFNIAELSSFSASAQTWQNAFRVNTPTGTSQNYALLDLTNHIRYSNPQGNSYIGGLDGYLGSLTIKDATPFWFGRTR